MQKLSTSWRAWSYGCIGFAAETKQCGCFVQFLGEDIMPSDAKNFFVSISYNLWNDIVQDDEDEKLTKEKVDDFLKPFHVVKNAK